jgi:hypothetical protein
MALCGYNALIVMEYINASLLEKVDKDIEEKIPHCVIFLASALGYKFQNGLISINHLQSHDKINFALD